MGYEKNTEHIGEGIANLVEQFKDTPKLQALLATFLRQIQEVEDAASDVLTETNLDTAVGVQLDNIGAVVGEPRSGRSDLQYSTAIRVRQLLSLSEGTPENIIELIRAITIDVGLTVDLQEFFPAGFIARIVEPIDPDVVDTDQIGSIVASGRPAGVRGIVTFGVLGSFQYDTGLGYDEGKYGGAVSA